MSQSLNSQVSKNLICSQNRRLDVTFVVGSRDKSGFKLRRGHIDAAIKQIDEVLNKLNSISDPILSDYSKNIKMVKVDEERD